VQLLGFRRFGQRRDATHATSVVDVARLRTLKQSIVSRFDVVRRTAAAAAPIEHGAVVKTKAPICSTAVRSSVRLAALDERHDNVCNVQLASKQAKNKQTTKHFDASSYVV
jgi:hypothetical protein